MLSRNERSASCRAALLGVVIGEERPLIRYAVNIWRSTAHHAAMVGTDIPNADVIRHDDENVRFFLVSIGSKRCKQYPAENPGDGCPSRHVNLSIF